MLDWRFAPLMLIIQAPWFKCSLISNLTLEFKSSDHYLRRIETDVWIFRCKIVWFCKESSHPNAL